MLQGVLIIFLLMINTVMLANTIKKQNIDLLTLLVALISIIGFWEVIVGVINIFGIPISNNLHVAIYSMLAIALFFVNRTTFKIKFAFSKYEVGAIIILSFIWMLLALHMFGVSICWTYPNSDPAVHFMNAMRIYRDKKLNGMYFTSLINCGVIEFCSSVLDEVRLYKAYICSDVILNYMESIFFFALMHENAKEKRAKKYLPITYLLFILGYPIYSYAVGGYNYWGMGVVLCGYVIYWLRRYENEENNQNWICYFIALGCLCVAICYMMFVPFIYIATWIVLLKSYRKDNKLFNLGKYVALNLKVFLVPCIMSIYYCFFVFWGGNVSKAVTSLNIDAGQFNLLDSFVFLIPIIIGYIIYKSKNRHTINAYDISAIVLAINIILFFVLGMTDFISPYYFGKMYYPLWFFTWIFICDYISNMNREVMAYYIYYCIISLLSICTLEQTTIARKNGFVINKEIELYSNNVNTILFRDWNYNALSTDKRELYSYIIEELEDKTIMLADIYQTYEVYLYEAVTGNYSSMYCWYCVDDEESFKKIEEDNIPYLIVLKDTDFYRENKRKLQEFSIIKENESGCIYSAN